MNGVHRAQTDHARFDLISHETYTKHLSKSKSVLTFKQKLETRLHSLTSGYLTIIPQARMDSESIAHEAEGQRTFNNENVHRIKMLGLTPNASYTRYSANECRGKKTSLAGNPG